MDYQLAIYLLATIFAFVEGFVLGITYERYKSVKKGLEEIKPVFKEIPRPTVVVPPEKHTPKSVVLKNPDPQSVREARAKEIERAQLKDIQENPRERGTFAL